MVLLRGQMSQGQLAVTPFRIEAGLREAQSEDGECACLNPGLRDGVRDRPGGTKLAGQSRGGVWECARDRTFQSERSIRGRSTDLAICVDLLTAPVEFYDAPLAALGFPQFEKSATVRALRVTGAERR